VQRDGAAVKFLRVTYDGGVRLIAINRIEIVRPTDDGTVESLEGRAVIRLQSGGSYYVQETVEEIEAQIKDLQRVRLGDLPRR